MIYFENKLNELDIFYYTHKFINSDDNWFDCGNDPYMKRLTDEEMMKYFNECLFKYQCLTLENGFLSICSRATISYLIQGFNVEDKKDGFFIRKSFNFIKLKKFLKEKKPVEACYYCYGTQLNRRVKPGEQMSKEEICKTNDLIKNKLNC